MADTSTVALMGVAAAIGFTHTITGPDHYLPFVMLSRAKKWKIRKSLLITFICGIAHVLSSVILGFIGYGLGSALKKLEIIESFRGDIAAWLLFSFGILYFIWGLKKAIRGETHSHSHNHIDGNGIITHSHDHDHNNEHLHAHEEKSRTVFWSLFIVFAFGPCEPLIPLLIYPAAESNFAGALAVAGVFSAVTVSTMLIMVTLGSYGMSRLKGNFFDRFAHAFAGFAITLSSACILFLGL